MKKKRSGRSLVAACLVDVKHLIVEAALWPAHRDVIRLAMRLHFYLRRDRFREPVMLIRAVLFQRFLGVVDDGVRVDEPVAVAVGAVVGVDVIVVVVVVQACPRLNDQYEDQKIGWRRRLNFHLVRRKVF